MVTFMTGAIVVARLADGLELGLDATPVGAGTLGGGVLGKTGELVQLDLNIRRKLAS